MPVQLFSNKNSSFLTTAVVNEIKDMSLAVSAVLLTISEVFGILFLYRLML